MFGHFDMRLCCLRPVTYNIKVYTEAFLVEVNVCGSIWNRGNWSLDKCK